MGFPSISDVNEQQKVIVCYIYIINPIKHIRSDVSIIDKNHAAQFRIAVPEKLAKLESGEVSCIYEKYIKVVLKPKTLCQRARSHFRTILSVVPK